MNNEECYYRIQTALVEALNGLALLERRSQDYFMDLVKQEAPDADWEALFSQLDAGVSAAVERLERVRLYR